jgi:ketosteroid isomerase-like protein
MGHLSEIARRRIAAVLLVAGIALAVLAIADLGPFSNPETEAQRAQASVERFFDAAHHGDFAASCAQLTKDAQRTLEQRAGIAAASQGLKGCDQILKLFLAKLEIARIDQVSVSGNQARVEAEVRATGSKHAHPTTVNLFLVNDRWKISDFGE